MTVEILNTLSIAALCIGLCYSTKSISCLRERIEELNYRVFDGESKSARKTK